MGVARPFTDLPPLGEPFPAHVLMETLGPVLAGLAGTTQLLAAMPLDAVLLPQLRQSLELLAAQADAAQRMLQR
jgi:hypothetical protein